MRPPCKVTPKPRFDDLLECTLQGSIGAAMNDNAQDISHRIKELEGAVRKARIEAMKLAATLLTKENALLAGTRASPNHPDHKGDLAALRARYEGLVRMADDTQATLEKLQAEEHSQKYHR